MKWITEINKARFWSKAKEVNKYCWEWQATKNKNGYGMFRINGDNMNASRVAYQIINGKIGSPKTQVLHKCDNRCCVNPDHLFTGTHQDNMKDKMRKGRGKTIGRTSKYHGVSFRNDSKRWRSIVRINGVNKNLGCFESEIEAAKVRDRAILDYNIESPLNFPLPIK